MNTIQLLTLIQYKININFKIKSKNIYYFLKIMTHVKFISYTQLELLSLTSENQISKMTLWN